MPTAPLASLSIDLDDEWVYRRSLGDPGWRARPSHFTPLAPRLEQVLEVRRATCFAVGVDARRDGGAALLRALHERGHEIASHSDQHDLRLHRRGRDEIELDLARASDSIAAATGTRPVGFRSPGYGTSRELRSALARGGYRYNASAFPSPAGLVARAWFGRRYPGRRLAARDVGDCALELVSGIRPRRIAVDGGELIEVPVAVMPYTRLPIHASQLLPVARRAPRLAVRYLELALALCARQGVGPALVVHPTDLLGPEDSPALRGFPAMDVPAARKLELLERWLALAEARFPFGTVAEQAAATAAGPGPPAPPSPAPARRP